MNWVMVHHYESAHGVVVNIARFNTKEAAEAVGEFLCGDGDSPHMSLGGYYTVIEDTENAKTSAQVSETEKERTAALEALKGLKR